MNVTTYLEIRKCYNVVRQRTASSSRIIFDEFATLCVLSKNKGLTATELAAAQGISCPTMTHRGNRLCDLGYMARTACHDDRRKLDCALTRRGTGLVDRTLKSMLACAEEGSGIYGLSETELSEMVVRAGSVPLQADSLSLLVFSVHDAPVLTVTAIVELTGMLQPTVSMAVSRLEASGIIERCHSEWDGVGRTTGIGLTAAGNDRMRQVVAQVESL